MMRAKTGFPENTIGFWSDISTISLPALNLVSVCGGELRDVPVKVRALLQSKGVDLVEMTERILSYAENIIRLPTARSIDLRNARSSGSMGEKYENNKFLMNHIFSMKKGCHIGGHIDDFDARHDEILMESLVAAWLALYFLGVPFIHPWEKVRRIADSRGGFPSGACVLKYVGDIYRLARQQMSTRLGEKNNDDGIREAIAQCKKEGKEFDAFVLVLSCSPLALLKRILFLDDDESLTPPELLQLAKCYATLQMRLYIHAGFPIKYFILQEPLQQRWRKLLEKNTVSYDEMMAEAVSWLKIVFPYNKEWQTVTLLKKYNKIAGMSTCILERDVGIFALDTSQDPMPFSGSILKSSLLSSYQEKLGAMDSAGGKTGLDTSNFFSLLNRGDKKVMEILREILPRDGAVEV